MMRRIFIRVLSVFFTALLIEATTCSGYFYSLVFADEASDTSAEIEEEDSFNSAYALEMLFNRGTYGYDHRIETFLFIGTDASGNSEIGENYRGSMADFLTLLVIDHTDDTYGFLELDRNTMTDTVVTDSNGNALGIEKLQLCISHYYGGNPEESNLNTVETVRLFLGDMESINGYYTLNMESVGALADAVDGVEVTLEDDLTSIDPSFVKGAAVILRGEQAEQYCRARMSVGDGDNKSRMRRQRAFMESFYKKAMNAMKTDLSFANDLYSLFKDVAETNISGNEVSRIAEAMRKGRNKGIIKIEGKTTEELFEYDGLVHEAFYANESSLIKALKELFSLHRIS